MVAATQYAESCKGTQLSCTTEELDTARPYKYAGKLQERTDVALVAAMLSHVREGEESFRSDAHLRLH